MNSLTNVAEDILLDKLVNNSVWSAFTSYKIGLTRGVEGGAESGVIVQARVDDVVFRRVSDRVVMLDGEYAVPPKLGVVSGLIVYGVVGTNIVPIIHAKFDDPADLRIAETAKLHGSAVTFAVPLNVSDDLAYDMTELLFMGAGDVSRITCGNLHIVLYSGDPLSELGGFVGPYAPVRLEQMVRTGGVLTNKESIVVSDPTSNKAVTHVALTDGNQKILATAPLSKPVMVYPRTSIEFKSGRLVVAVV